MDDDKKLRPEATFARREILRGSVKLSLAVIGASMLGAACGKKAGTDPKCDDTTGMPPEQVEQRKVLHYTDKAPTAEKTCANCQQFEPGAPDKCGTCKVMKGPVSPKGYCDSWLAKPAT